MRRIVFILVSVIALTSCTEYAKLVKSSDYDLKWEKAKEYYALRNYSRCSYLLEQIMPRFRFTEDAEEMQWMYADCYYQTKDYYSAVVAFQNFYDTYQYGEYAEEAYFNIAMCDYFLSPRAELDQTYTTTAINDFSYFIARYPNSSRVEECNAYIKELQDKLVEKSYISAKLYYDMGQHKAAITALTNALKEYPLSSYREELRYLKLVSLYEYADNSVFERRRERFQDVLDDYFTYVEEYPEGVYQREVNRIYRNTSDFLGIDSSVAETIIN